jgi:hypothetical protein
LTKSIKPEKNSLPAAIASLSYPAEHRERQDETKRHLQSMRRAVEVQIAGMGENFFEKKV